MLRKQLLKDGPLPSSRRSAEKDITAIATVLVTSEDPHHPIDNVFDGNGGKGASHWMAAVSGEQRVILAFDAPQAIRGVHLEVEEKEVQRTQELSLSVSRDGGRTYDELLRQEYNFSPPQTTFEPEQWSVNAEGVTHLQLVVKPDKGGKACRATLTSLAVQ